MHRITSHRHSLGGLHVPLPQHLLSPEAALFGVTRNGWFSRFPTNCFGLYPNNIGGFGVELLGSGKLANGSRLDSIIRCTVQRWFRGYCDLRLSDVYLHVVDWGTENDQRCTLQQPVQVLVVWSYSDPF